MAEEYQPDVLAKFPLLQVNEWAVWMENELERTTDLKWLRNMGEWEGQK